MKLFRNRWFIGAILVMALIGAVWGFSRNDAQASPVRQTGGTANVIVQVGQLQPAPAAAEPTGWDTTWSQMLGIKLLAQLDSSGDDAWSAADHPLVYMTSQGPGYGSAAFGGAFLSEVQKAPGLAIIDADTHEAVATAQYETGLESYAENHGLGVSADGQWIYTQGNHPDSNVRGGAVLNIINARTLKVDKIIESRVHHARVIHDSYSGKDLVLVDGWGTFFALDPLDDNRVVGAVDPADLQGSGYLGFGDPTGRWLLISVRTGFLESDGGIAVVSLEDWKVKARINTHDGSPIWVAYTGDGKTAYVSDGHESKVAKIDMSAENPAMWRVTGMANAGAIGPYGLTLNWDDTMLFAFGKGEASHNQGKTMGYIDTRMFAEPDMYRGWGTVLGQLVTNCLRQDHAIVHPDPAKNEMWISCNSSFDNVVVDMGAIEVTDVIPQPNGGSSHNGAFVAYDADWKGELLSDTNGFHGSAVITKLQALAGAVAPGGPLPTPTPEGPGAGK